MRLDGPQAQSLLLALNWRVETEAYSSSMEMATAMADAAALAGAAAGRAGPLIVAGESSRRLGLWEQSRRHLREALEIARASRQLGAEAMSSASLARLAAAQGDEQECLTAISNLERCGDVFPTVMLDLPPALRHDRDWVAQTVAALQQADHDKRNDPR